VFFGMQGAVVQMAAAEFLVEAVVRRFPGEVTVLALGPLTNIALAMQLDSRFSESLVRWQSARRVGSATNRIQRVLFGMRIRTLGPFAPTMALRRKRSLFSR
jgi:Inosine-uridine preferring nucleoside hydrolase